MDGPGAGKAMWQKEGRGNGETNIVRTDITVSKVPEAACGNSSGCRSFPPKYCQAVLVVGCVGKLKQLTEKGVLPASCPAGSVMDNLRLLVAGKLQVQLTHLRMGACMLAVYVFVLLALSESFYSSVKTPYCPGGALTWVQPSACRTGDLSPTVEPAWLEQFVTNQPPRGPMEGTAAKDRLAPTSRTASANFTQPSSLPAHIPDWLMLNMRSLRASVVGFLARTAATAWNQLAPLPNPTPAAFGPNLPEVEPPTQEQQQPFHHLEATVVNTTCTLLEMPAPLAAAAAAAQFAQTAAAAGNTTCSFDELPSAISAFGAAEAAKIAQAAAAAANTTCSFDELPPAISASRAAAARAQQEAINAAHALRCMIYQPMVYQPPAQPQCTGTFSCESGCNDDKPSVLWVHVLANRVVAWAPAEEAVRATVYSMSETPAGKVFKVCVHMFSLFNSRFRLRTSKVAKVPQVASAWFSLVPPCRFEVPSCKLLPVTASDCVLSLLLLCFGGLTYCCCCLQAAASTAQETAGKAYKYTAAKAEAVSFVPGTVSVPSIWSPGPGHLVQVTWPFCFASTGTPRTGCDHA
jgi:hypothetical protein